MLRTIFKTMLLVAIVFVTAYGLRCAAQMGGPPPDASGQQQRDRDREDVWTQQQKREMVKKQNEKRQEDIKKDTYQLLDLATELKQYVDKTNENIISLDVSKKAEQIEKLAKSVKEKMKGSN
jgi:hypothetical protein